MQSFLHSANDCVKGQRILGGGRVKRSFCKVGETCAYPQQKELSPERALGDAIEIMHD